MIGSVFSDLRSFRLSDSPDNDFSMHPDYGPSTINYRLSTLVLSPFFSIFELMTKKLLITFCFILCFACISKAQEVQGGEKKEDISLSGQYQQMMEKIITNIPSVASSTTSKVLDFAKSMIGIHYRYASSNPSKGFDCSGFVSYVFSNFGIKVPRSSTEFASTGVPVKLADAKVGDVLIFTGTNPKIRRIGHVGIIYSIDNGEVKFIHSTSGKANGVTITDFNDYYKSRFMKAVSIVE